MILWQWRLKELAGSQNSVYMHKMYGKIFLIFVHYLIIYEEHLKNESIVIMNIEKDTDIQALFREKLIHQDQISRCCELRRKSRL